MRDLEYANVDGESLQLDLYLPEKSETKPPLLVWIHGGGWTKGSKSGINPIFIRLTAEGYAAASIDYRLDGLTSHPKQIHDCKGAIRWLRANADKYGYDVTRIGVGGGSAGGHLVLLLGLSSGIEELEGDVGGNLDQSSQVHAVVDLFGPSALGLVCREERTVPPQQDAGTAQVRQPRDVSLEGRSAPADLPRRQGSSWCRSARASTCTSCIRRWAWNRRSTSSRALGTAVLSSATPPATNWSRSSSPGTSSRLGLHIEREHHRSKVAQSNHAVDTNFISPVWNRGGAATTAAAEQDLSGRIHNRSCEARMADIYFRQDVLPRRLRGRMKLGLITLDIHEQVEFLQIALDRLRHEHVDQVVVN